MHVYVPPMDRPTVSVLMARQLLGDIGRDKVWRLIKARDLEVVRSGGRTLVLTDSISAYVARLRGGKAA